MTFEAEQLTIGQMMYRRPKFLEILIKVREEMAREADYDVDLFAEMVRGKRFSPEPVSFDLNNGDREKGRRGDREIESNPKSKI